MDYLVDEIEEVRTQNNRAWMNLLRLALKHAPHETRLIAKQIVANDKKVIALMEALANEE